ncbi:MAG TPA: alginate export family protein [Xanthomonadaceae bacterium]|nr:alginate export family protein [Xanthomonadaceae bacterium]
MRLPLALLPLAIAATSLPVHAADAAPAVGPVSFEWNLRLRHEHVGDDAFADDADATTLRLRAGVRFKLDNGFNALLEGEGIADAGDAYNSGANGRTTRPAITDPEGAELNQAFVGWKDKAFGVAVGRQRLLFDNQRWIGNSGWRQNEQTFDAVSADWKIAGDWSARYAYLGRVHRVAGDNALDAKARQRNLDSHLAELAWKHGVAQVSGYAWLHEDQDVASASTGTFGVRALADLVRDGNGFALALELARQRDYANNPLRFSHRYWLVEPAYTLRGTTLRAGWEHLGGDGTHALQTPLATLHAFNGWADKFTTTPAAGLEDRYLGAGGKLGAAKQYDWQVAWHDYRADTGAAHYGSEWNGSFGFPVAKGVRGLAKFAGYRADAFAHDTFKAWLQLEWSGAR